MTGSQLLVCHQPLPAHARVSIGRLLYFFLLTCRLTLFCRPLVCFSPFGPSDQICSYSTLLS